MRRGPLADSCVPYVDLHEYSTVHALLACNGRVLQPVHDAYKTSLDIPGAAPPPPGSSRMAGAGTAWANGWATCLGNVLHQEARAGRLFERAAVLPRAASHARRLNLNFAVHEQVWVDSGGARRHPGIQGRTTRGFESGGRHLEALSV